MLDQIFKSKFPALRTGPRIFCMESVACRAPMLECIFPPCKKVRTSQNVAMKDLSKVYRVREAKTFVRFLK